MSSDKITCYRIDKIRVSIPLEQGSVFRQIQNEQEQYLYCCLNPFGTGQCLPTITCKIVSIFLEGLNPFGTGQCLPTMSVVSEQSYKISLNPFGTGQCLPTLHKLVGLNHKHCLNPFGTGQCLPTEYCDMLEPEASLNPFGTGQCLPTFNLSLSSPCAVSIPLEQGSVFRQNRFRQHNSVYSGLNPFGTGQCLPTKSGVLPRLTARKVSIPLEQGSVFRQYGCDLSAFLFKSQSLWNRAVSSDSY